MIIYKANDKGFVTEICIINENPTMIIEATTKPFHEIRDYHTVEVNYNKYFFTIWIPFDNHFHKLNNEVIRVKDMQYFNNCYNVDERILIC